MRKIWVCDLKKLASRFLFLHSSFCRRWNNSPSRNMENWQKEEEITEKNKSDYSSRSDEAIDYKASQMGEKCSLGVWPTKASRNPWIFVQGLPCTDEKSHNYLDWHQRLWKATFLRCFLFTPRPKACIVTFIQFEEPRVFEQFRFRLIIWFY